MADDDSTERFKDTLMGWLGLLWGIVFVGTILALVWRFAIRPIWNHLTL